MADNNININITANDNASGVIDNVSGHLRRIESGVSTFNSAMRQYNTFMSGFNNTVVGMFKDMGAAVYDFTSDAIKNFTDFSKIQAETMGALANSYDKTAESQAKFISDSNALSGQAIQLGTYGVNNNGALSSAQEVAQLQTELVKAGVSAPDMVNTDVTEQVLKFAQANQLDSSTAVEFATKLSNQFNVPFGGKEFGLMLDKVSHAADTSVIDVKDIIQSMKYASGVSSGLGRSIDETLGMVSILGNFGLTGSQSGAGIQAFLTRLLTGDTQVMSKAMKEVAPQKALDYFYMFEDYAKSDGTDLTWDEVKSGYTANENAISGIHAQQDSASAAIEKAKEAKKIAKEAKDKEALAIADEQLKAAEAMKKSIPSVNSVVPQYKGKVTGNLRDMSDIIDTMDEVFGDLNDEEEAWFAKKLFGLYQMKSAYALINGDDTDLIDVMNEIKNNSLGTNDNKLNLLQESQFGKITSFQNLFDGIKTQLGSDISSLTTAILDEATNYLSNKGNYEINWDNIRAGLNTACDAVEETFGSAIADSIRDIGNTTIDLGQIFEEFAPTIGESFFKMFADATNIDSEKYGGGISGLLGNIKSNSGNVIDDWTEMISTLKSSVGELPDDMQGLANATISVIDFFGKLAALNIATQIAQLVSSVLQIAMMTIRAATVIVNGNSVTGGGAGTGGAGAGGAGAGGAIGGAVIGAAGIAGAVGGAYLGTKIADDVGYTAGDIARKAGASDSTAQAVDDVATFATPVATGVIGGNIAKGVGAAGVAGITALKSQGLMALLENAGLLVGPEASTTGLAGLTTGGAAVASGALFGLPLAAATMYNIAKENAGMQKNAQQTGAIVASGGHIGFDNGGNVIKDNDGNIVDINKSLQELIRAREQHADKYAYNNGDTSVISASAPDKKWSNLWGHTSGYKDEYAKWEQEQKAGRERLESEKSQFYGVQNEYLAKTGKKLTYSDYSDNKQQYTQQYAASKEVLTSAITSSLSTLFNKNSVVTGGGKSDATQSSINDKDTINKLLNNVNKTQQTSSSGLDKDVVNRLLSNTGKQQQQTYELTNDISLTPSFKVSAPVVNVSVHVDKQGNTTTEKSIVNSSISSTLNTWFSKSVSRNGTSTKK